MGILRFFNVDRLLVLPTTSIYDKSSLTTEVHYPSGQAVTYQLDTVGRPESITTHLPGSATPRLLVDDVTYDNIGALRSFQYGNGVIMEANLDDFYRLDTLLAKVSPTAAPLFGLRYGYDANDNIDTITNLVQAAKSQSFAYDPLYRLTQAIGPYGQIDYGYDEVGNRESKIAQATAGTITETYQYASDSNRLSSVAVDNGNVITARPLGYDDVGNITQDERDGSTFIYSYNHNNRLNQVTDGQNTLATYLYNAQGQRVAKTAGGVTQHSHYDLAGMRLSESQGNSHFNTEYVYLAGIPVAGIKNVITAIPEEDKLFYIVTDHLATPKAVLDQSQTTVWTQTSTPFGITDINEDPDGDGQAFSLDARFPGQYADAETGLSYNYFRDYDPSLGRYVQSDPIGLAAGINSYGYVGGSPLRNSDAYGLCPG